MEYLSGVDVDKLNDHRSEVEEAISKVKGKIGFIQ